MRDGFENAIGAMSGGLESVTCGCEFHQLCLVVLVASHIRPMPWPKAGTCQAVYGSELESFPETMFPDIVQNCFWKRP